MNEEQRRKIFDAIQNLKTIIITAKEDKFRLFYRNGRYFWDNEPDHSTIISNPQPILRSSILKEVERNTKEIKKINVL